MAFNKNTFPWETHVRTVDMWQKVSGFLFTRSIDTFVDIPCGDTLAAGKALQHHFHRVRSAYRAQKGQADWDFIKIKVVQTIDGTVLRFADAEADIQRLNLKMITSTGEKL